MPKLPENMIGHKIDLHSILDVRQASEMDKNVLTDKLSQGWIVKDVTWARDGVHMAPTVEIAPCVNSILHSVRVGLLNEIAAGIAADAVKFKEQDKPAQEGHLLEAVKSIKIAIHNLSQVPIAVNGLVNL